MKRILLVDDEQSVLIAFQRELRDFYDVETFDNPVVALERCKNTQFDLVVADYIMPGMDGIEFLKRFGLMHPEASRLVLSGAADIDALIRMINETRVYRFLVKPWEKAELLFSIQQALTHQGAMLESKLLADTPHDNRNAPMVFEDHTPFHIALVESDKYLLNLMFRALSDENGRGDIYAKIQQELAQTLPVKSFKCILNGFQNAHAALAHLETSHCDLIIAAQTLPDMDGIRLLQKIRHSHPGAALILLNDEIDESELLQIQESKVADLVPVHWAGNELRSDARRQAWNLHQLKTAAIQVLAYREFLPGNDR